MVAILGSLTQKWSRKRAERFAPRHQRDAKAGKSAGKVGRWGATADRTAMSVRQAVPQVEVAA